MTHTPLTDKQLRQLTNPIHQNRVSQKQGMSYVEAWDIKATLIRMFGFGGFSSEVVEAKIINSEQVAQVNNAQKTNWAVTAQATVRLTIHQTGAVYTETAIAGSKQPDFTESADMAIKSAESDALKRAAIFLGTQFGLSLYNNGDYADVVKVVLAPDQTWPPVAPAEAMAAIVEGQRPGTAAASVEHLRGEGVDDAAHQQNMANLNSALSVQVKKQEQRPGTAPLYRDPTLDPGYRDSDAYNDGMDAIESEAMAAEDGREAEALQQ